MGGDKERLKHPPWECSDWKIQAILLQRAFSPWKHGVSTCAEIHNPQQQRWRREPTEHLALESMGICLLEDWEHSIPRMG